LKEFDEQIWQMSSAEQAAIEGLLSRIAPRLAIEIGTAEGAGSRRLAAHVEELHCFDLFPPSLELPRNVEMHVGDSHELLPQLLARLADAGRNVDFVVVDGDHSASGVRRDIEDLLDSPALGDTVIVIHDTANERVRHGLDAIRFAAWPKVARVHMDWLPGQVFREPRIANEIWCGLGLVVVDATRTAYGDGEVVEQRYFPAGPLLADARDAMLAQGPNAHDPRRAGEPSELEDLRWELEHARDTIDRQNADLAGMLNSPSWKVTEPLRKGKRRLASARGALGRRKKSRDADQPGRG
jgi:hypothetical protein